MYRNEMEEINYLYLYLYLYFLVWIGFWSTVLLSSKLVPGTQIRLKGNIYVQRVNINTNMSFFAELEFTNACK